MALKQGPEETARCSRIPPVFVLIAKLFDDDRPETVFRETVWTKSS